MASKRQLKQMIETLGDDCPECKKGKMEVVEGVVNIGHFFLRCNNCGFEWDE